VAGERDDEAAREVVPELLLEAMEGRRARVRDSCQSGAMLEEELSTSLALRKRAIVHGPPLIGHRLRRRDP
jgi:hypothetical protein